jgi:hypothetical protein
LVELLQQEQQVMIAGQVHLLEDLADSKSKVLDELAMHSQNRARLMKSLGLSDSDTVYIWLADKPEERQAWLALEDLIHRAQGINQLNGSFHRAATGPGGRVAGRAASGGGRHPQLRPWWPAAATGWRTPFSRFCLYFPYMAAHVVGVPVPLWYLRHWA